MIITVKPKKISIYLAKCQRTAAQVRALTGADIVINGTLYTFATMLPCLDFKASGVVYSDERDMYEGYGWNNNSAKLVRTTEMAKYDNFISSCNIIKNGNFCSVDGIAWVAGARQRTGIGLTSDGKLLIYATQTPTTIAKMQGELAAAGCIDAINLDGGGSTQLASAQYGNLTSSRMVHNYICIWEEKPAAGSSNTSTGAGNAKPAPSIPAEVWKTVPADVTIFPLVVQNTCNLNMRQLPTSASRLVKVVPKGQKITVLGYAASWNKVWLKTNDGYIYRSYTACRNPYAEPVVQLRRGSIGEGVKWMQWALGALKYKGANGVVLGCDGQFGPNTEYAVKSFQKAYGLVEDGVCGAKTIEMIKKCVA